jgi:hypothetical protein
VLLHRLEQAGLGLRRGPVDLVGKDQVGEDRPGLEPKDPLAALLDEDVRAGDVGRHQVRRELDPVEGAVDDVGDRADEHGLAEPGDAFEENMGVRQEAGEGLPHQLALTDDDLANLRLDCACSLGKHLWRERCGGVRRGGRFHDGLRVFGSAGRVGPTGSQFPGSSELK